MPRRNNAFDGRIERGSVVRSDAPAASAWDFASASLIGANCGTHSDQAYLFSLFGPASGGVGCIWRGRRKRVCTALEPQAIRRDV